MIKREVEAFSLNKNNITEKAPLLRINPIKGYVE